MLMHRRQTGNTKSLGNLLQSGGVSTFLDILRHKIQNLSLPIVQSDRHKYNLSETNPNVKSVQNKIRLFAHRRPAPGRHQDRQRPESQTTSPGPPGWYRLPATPFPCPTFLPPPATPLGWCLTIKLWPW